MSFDVPSIIVTLIFSAVGFVYFAYGKKQQEFRFMALGMALMTYTYFVSSLAWNIGVGVVLTVAAFLPVW